ncbi:STAS domain-containing protein [Noviherbaspirillum soli]|uniref:STAS domain-containing protein n=1 Tax=Noviherbaspirillum soli TaxID=1064518 RepID=UPI00188A0A43|nr:STAS domain-containing protein [Noviherbaspirillum soli]
MDIINISREQNVAIIRPATKRIDSAVAPAFKEAVLKLVQAGDKRIVLDLEGVDFMDSSGLGALVSVLKGLGGSGALGVCNVQGGVQSLFKLTRMDKVFTISDNLAEAVQKAAG